jgi:hypothetical protein
MKFGEENVTGIDLIQQNVVVKHIIKLYIVLLVRFEIRENGQRREDFGM